MVERWTTPPDLPGRPPSWPCYLSAEFLLGPHLGNNLINLGISTRAREALAELGLRPRRAAGPGGGARSGQRRPGTARRLLPGLAGDPGDPRDRLRHPLRVRHLRPGDPRRLAGRDHRQLAALRQPVGDRQARRSQLRGQVRAATPSVPSTSGRRPRATGSPTHVVKGVAYDTPIPGYGVQHRQHPAPVDGRGRRNRSTSRPSTSATTTARCEEKIVSENITKVLYPNDETDRGQGAAARAAVLLRVLFAAGHDPRFICRQRLTSTSFHEKCRRPAQRHPPGDGRRRTDAAAARRARHGLGRGLGHHPADLRLHQPHAAARGAGEVAGARCSSACCRATWRSSTRSTAASSTRSRSRSPATTSGSRRMSLIEEDGEQHRAHGPPGLRRQPRDQRRGRAAHRAAASRAVLKDFHELWPEKFSNKTNGVTPRRWLVAGQPAAGGADHATRSATAGSRDLEQLRELEPFADDAGVPAASGAASSAANKARAGRRASRQNRASRSTRTRCSTSRSSGSTSTSGSSSTCCTSSRCTTGSRQIPSLDIAAAHVHLRRQGRAGLLHGQADHQADQLRRRGGQQRPGRAGPAQGRVRARTSTSSIAPADLSRRPTCPSRSRPPARRPRAPAT